MLPGSVAGICRSAHLRAHERLPAGWYTDIGDSVKKGQLMAEIDTPEVDQQLRQSEADLATAKANANLARTTDIRWERTPREPGGLATGRGYASGRSGRLAGASGICTGPTSQGCTSWNPSNGYWLPRRRRNRTQY